MNTAGLGIRIHVPVEIYSESIFEEDKELCLDEKPVDPVEFIKELFDELENFDEIHKSVFLLHYREGFSLKEIGQTLEISEGTVKSRLFYTRKRLSEILSKYQFKNE